MNRDKALTIADRIMTRIETDKAVHKDAIADEIQAGDALDEIVDIISHDGEKWVHRDGTPFDTDADVKQEGIDGEIHALLLDAEKRASKLHAVLTDFTFPRIEPDTSDELIWARKEALRLGLITLDDVFDSADLDDRDTA